MTASISLFDWTTQLTYAVNPGGQTIVVMSEDEMVSRLTSAFWRLRLAGADFLAAWTIDNTSSIVPQPNAPAYQQGIPSAWYVDDNSGNLGNEIMEAIVLFAAWDIALTTMQNLKTSTAYRAGAVSAEVSQSASVQQAVLRNITERISLILSRLSDLGSSSVTILDAVINSTENILGGNEWFIR